MKLKNITKHNFAHSELDEGYKLKMLILKPNEVLDIPDKVAKSWLRTGGVIEFVEPKDLKDLQSENDELKKQLKELKKDDEAPKKSKSTKKKG